VLTLFTALETAEGPICNLASMTVDPSGKTLAEWHHRQKLVLPAQDAVQRGFFVLMPGRTAVRDENCVPHEILHNRDLESSKSSMIHGRPSDFEMGLPMWTKENRGHCDRSRLRYPSDLTDEEWALGRPLIAPARRGGSKRTVDACEVVNDLIDVPIAGWSDDKVTIRPYGVGAPHNLSAETSHGH